MSHLDSHQLSLTALRREDSLLTGLIGIVDASFHAAFNRGYSTYPVD